MMHLIPGTARTPEEYAELHQRDRRERIAVAAMQGLISSGNLPARVTDAEVAHAAVLLADALIAELDKKRTP